MQAGVWQAQVWNQWELVVKWVRTHDGEPGTEFQCHSESSCSMPVKVLGAGQDD